MRVFPLAALVLSLSLMPIGLSAQEFSRGDGSQGRGLSKLLQQLNLSTDQQQQLATLRQQHRQGIEPLRQQAKQLYEEMESLIAKGASNQEVLTKFNQLQPLQQQISQQKLENRLAVRSVLTSAQQAQLTQLIRQRQEQYKAQRKSKS